MVSTALLGIGASGTYLMLHTRWPLTPSEAAKAASPIAQQSGSLMKSARGRVKGWFREPSPLLLVIGPVLFSMTTVASYLALNRIPFDLVKLAWEPRQIAYLVLAYGILAIPFFFVGLTIATALIRRARQAGLVYCGDLLGAASGALLPLILYPIMGATGAVMMAGLLGLVSGLFLWMAEGRSEMKWLISLLVGMTLLLLIGYIIAPSFYAIRLSPYKGLMTALRYPDAQLLSTRWNILSRVDIVSSPAIRFAPGLALTYPGDLPPQIGVTLDGDQLHAITAYNGSWDHRHGFLRYLPTAAPYFLSPPGNVLIIEPGGGLDVLMALYFNAKTVSVVERNPALLEVVRHPGPKFQNRIYEDPRISVHLAEARSYLSSGDSSFDLIVLSSLHTLGAGGLGLYGFAEDYSKTLEAMAQYYEHLKENGWLVMTRYLEPIPLQELRLTATVIETLEGLGISEPDRRIVLLRSWGTLTLLVKRGIVSHQDVQKLKGFSQANRFDLDYYPGIEPSEANRFNRFPEPIYFRFMTELLTPDHRADLYRTYPFDIRPVSDDRPFFGYVLKLSTFKEAYHLVRGKWLFFIEGGYLLPVMLLQALLLAAIFILIPTGLGTDRTENRTVLTKKSRILTYFMLIAVAFMGVEIAMIQRLILFLGHPVYAISAVLGSLLFFAGVGSLLTNRWAIHSFPGQRTVLLVLSLVIIGEGVGLLYLLPHLMGMPIGSRFLWAVLFLAPLGILMGMPFPLGIGYLERSGQKTVIPWAWAVNGSTSVVAAILTVMVAMEIGFTAVFVGAALAYALAAWTLGEEGSGGSKPSLAAQSRHLRA